MVCVEHLEETHALAIPHVEVEEPIDWSWAGGFYDSEGYLDATVREYEKYGYRYRALYTTIEAGQEDKSLLERLRDFIKAELGIWGSILDYYEERGIYLLQYKAHEDCYRLAKTLLPHLHLLKRREQAKKLLTETKRYAETMASIERERHRVKVAEMWERILAL